MEKTIDNSSSNKKIMNKRQTKARVDKDKILVWLSALFPISLYLLFNKNLAVGNQSSTICITDLAFSCIFSMK